MKNKSSNPQGKKTLTGKPSLSSSSASTRASTLLSKYSKVLPLTRIYMSLCCLLTFLSLLLGEEMSQGLFAYTKESFPFQPWRYVTAASFLGPPSIQSLMSVYYLYEYGSTLEKTFGTSDFLAFLLSQVFLLSTLAGIFMTPFFANSVVTAMLHVLSRQLPHQNVKWLIFTVPYWTLPYGLLLSDVLQTQSPASATPHVMGILTGHVFYFFNTVWPKFGGKNWLEAPDFVKRKFDEDGIDRKEKRVKRKRGRGKVLGGS
ncbi:hypothetical protein TrVE_jg5236 [Triparma verrucosa]|uniref:Derlin n=1 Tax=Triparma verrucosa TaxID=1606542 RepID=A0A9W7B458_9STRA|nr:hypothetical protein TrVE_jg5236 [Triparma verrucosa]